MTCPELVRGWAESAESVVSRVKVVKLSRRNLAVLGWSMFGSTPESL